MSKNENYKNEIASANAFVIEHAAEHKLQNFLSAMRDLHFLSHSDRWSRCYDFLHENYPEVTGSLVTGLTYWLED